MGAVSTNQSHWPVGDCLYTGMGRATAPRSSCAEKPGLRIGLLKAGNDADAKAAEIYASAYNQSPESVSFYEFTRTMQSYMSIIATNTTLVLSTNSDLFKFLKGMAPDAEIVPQPHVPPN